jgi:hypothetical protein
MNAVVSKEITQLFPQGKEIKVGGNNVVIKPIGFGKFPKVLEILDGLKIPDGKEKDEANVQMLFNIVKNNAESMMQLCALGSGLSRAQLDALGMDEGLELVQAILEVNVDFFAKTLLPKITEMTEKLGSAAEGLKESTGAGSSPS